MPKKARRIRRETLVNYANTLGRKSIAAEVLRDYDARKARHEKVAIEMTNNTFRLVTA